MLDPADRIETVLLEHTQRPDGSCACGAAYSNPARTWRRHVAAEIARALSDLHHEEDWAELILTNAGWTPEEVHIWWRSPSGHLPDRARPASYVYIDPAAVRRLVQEKAKRPGL